MNQFSELKNFVLDELRKSFASTIITLWFVPMNIIEISGNEVKLTFPNNRKAFVEANYLSILTDTFSAVMGVPVSLKISSENEEPENEKEAETDQDEKAKNAYFTRYNPNYTFENFIVGKSNQLAQSVALGVAEHPFHLNNPLYLYGPSGLGKTHLLFAIINKLKQNNPNYRILYVTGEEFTNELVEALAQNKPMSFREKYRNLDVLLVDDIQFIAGKKAIQEEFFHTFEALFQNNKQLILASDVSPEEINELESRLKTRFSWGMVADIQPPDLELRTAIFRRKSLDFGFDLDYSVLNYLAENITQNIRQIEGAIRKLRAECLVSGDKCTVQMAERVLGAFLNSKKNDESILDRILTMTSKKYMVSKEDLCGNKRNSNIAFARHYAIYLLRKSTSYSQKQIAKMFNRKDHTTIMNSINVIEEKIHTDPVFSREINLALDDLKKK